MTDAETWEHRYLMTEIKYGKLFLAAAERELELFEERMRQAETRHAATQLTMPAPGALDRALAEARAHDAGPEHR